MILKHLITRSARMSVDFCYRYSLTRTWGKKEGFLLWIMLNPSTADHTKDDPTIRRCMRFTDDFGFQSMEVVNLFALRTPTPSLLWKAENPVGPENDDWIEDKCRQARYAVLACGETSNNRIRERVEVVIRIARKLNVRLQCLGMTKNGSPRHPLYVRGTQVLEEWDSKRWISEGEK